MLDTIWSYLPLVGVGFVLLLAVYFLSKCIHYIRETEVGVVTKNFGRQLEGGNPIAFNGEAGYQADLLSTGLKFVPWPLKSLSKHPWVQIPAGKIGIVQSQVGAPLPAGAKTAIYKDEFGDFGDVRAFVNGGGQKGIQRTVLPPGALRPLHPVAFLVITEDKVFGIPMGEEYKNL
jgi:hypothetical protein